MAEVYRVMLTSQDVTELVQKIRSAETWQEKRKLLLFLSSDKLVATEVLEPLADAFIDIAQSRENRMLRRTAVRLLGEMRSQKAVVPLIVMLLKSPTSDVQKAAAWALGRIGDVRAVEFLGAVLADEAEEMTVREKTAEALGMIANDTAVAFLIDMLDTEMRDKVASILKKIGKSAVSSLISALCSKSFSIRKGAIYVLGEMREPNAVEPLIAILEDESMPDFSFDDVQCKAIEALVKIGGAGVVESFIRLAAKHTEDIVTCTAVRALGEMRDTQAVEPLISVLKDPEIAECPHLRLETIWALGKIGDSRAVETLMDIFRGKRVDDWLKADIAWALSMLDDPRSELLLLAYYKETLDILVGSKKQESAVTDVPLLMIEGISMLLSRIIVDRMS